MRPEEKPSSKILGEDKGRHVTTLLFVEGKMRQDTK